MRCKPNIMVSTLASTIFVRVAFEQLNIPQALSLMRCLIHILLIHSSVF